MRPETFLPMLFRHRLAASTLMLKPAHPFRRFLTDFVN